MRELLTSSSSPSPVKPWANVVRVLAARSPLGNAVACGVGLCWLMRAGLVWAADNRPKLFWDVGAEVLFEYVVEGSRGRAFRVLVWVCRMPAAPSASPLFGLPERASEQSVRRFEFCEGNARSEEREHGGERATPTSQVLPFPKEQEQGSESDARLFSTSGQNASWHAGHWSSRGRDPLC